MLATIAIHALDSVSVNLLEVYNEEIHDLLVDKKNQELLEIRRGPQGVFIPGLSTVPVKSAEEVMEVGLTSQVANCLLNKRPFWGGGRACMQQILAKGNSHRMVTSTSMNEQSSRSHSLLIVNVAATTTPADADGPVTKSAALTLVDLAGSERISKSEVTGQVRESSVSRAEFQRIIFMLCACVVAS